MFEQTKRQLTRIQNIIDMIERDPTLTIESKLRMVEGPMAELESLHQALRDIEEDAHKNRNR